ncbi:MAG: 4-hydroxy-tetrahydrodipicolinate reductase, partial [Dethiobacteria bacterium]
MEKIKVAVNGAYGRMGREVCQAILDDGDLELTGVFDLLGRGEDIGEVLGRQKLGLLIQNLGVDTLAGRQARVLVDFTTPMAVMENIRTSLQAGVRPVVGTTGITQVDLELINEWVEKAGIGAVV